jgi:NADH dehydrogenase (ubiquinone) 1 alpha subcomplex subunit 9
MLTWSRNFTLEDVHVEGSERIADAVAKYDVDRFIHVSSFNASKDSPSEFFRTKARGEEVVRSIYPETTIVRPAPMFGWEDRLLNRLATAKSILTSNNMQERFWPTHVIDVGMALERIAYDDTTASQTFELYGPQNYSLAELAQIVDKEALKNHRHINVPKQMRAPLLEMLNKFLWFDVGSADQVEREFLDQVIDKSAKTYKDLGITPGHLEEVAYQYLVDYRSAAVYDLPPQTEREKREDRKYLHVIDDQ